MWKIWFWKVNLYKEKCQFYKSRGFVALEGLIVCEWMELRKQSLTDKNEDSSQSPLAWWLLQVMYEK